MGQDVDFWNLRDNRMQHGRITQFKSDRLLILAENPPQYWWVSYAAIQFDPSQAPPPVAPRQMKRSDFAVGDTVSFEGRDLIQQLGAIESGRKRSPYLSHLNAPSKGRVNRPLTDQRQELRCWFVGRSCYLRQRVQRLLKWPPISRQQFKLYAVMGNEKK